MCVRSLLASADSKILRLVTGRQLAKTWSALFPPWTDLPCRLSVWFPTCPSPSSFPQNRASSKESPCPTETQASVATFTNKNCCFWILGLHQLLKDKQCLWLSNWALQPQGSSLRYPVGLHSLDDPVSYLIIQGC